MSRFHPFGAVQFKFPFGPSQAMTKGKAKTPCVRVFLKVLGRWYVALFTDGFSVFSGAVIHSW